MVVDLKTEAINLNELKKNEKIVLTVEGDIIVPDVNPDVGKLLLVDASSSVLNKRINNAKAEIDGCVFVNILYAPENTDEISPKIKGINAKFDYEEAVSVSEENLSIWAKSRVIKVEHKVINSRKINVKVTVELCVKIYSQNSHLIAVSAEDDEKKEMKMQNISIHQNVTAKQEEFVFTENLEVPAAKCDIEEILKTAVTINKGECKISEGKISLKGSVDVVTLYSGFEEGYIFECMEHDLPFFEEIEVEELTEECVCSVTYDIKEMSAKVTEDINGDPRIIELSLVLCANITASKTVDMEILEDIYYPGKKCELKKVTKSLRRNINEGTSRVALKDVMVLSEGASEIYRVLGMTATPIIKECEVLEDKLILKGDIKSLMVYSTKEGIPESFVSDFSFEHVIEIDNAPKGSICEYDLAVTGVNYNILSEKEVEIRTNVEFFVSVTEGFELSVISDCEVTEEPEENKKMPQIVIYFVQKEDALWDIAKHYNTTIKCIKDANHIEELPKAGERIIIPAR